MINFLARKDFLMPISYNRPVADDVGFNPTPIPNPPLSQSRDKLNSWYGHVTRFWLMRLSGHLLGGSRKTFILLIKKDVCR